MILRTNLIAISDSVCDTCGVFKHGLVQIPSFLLIIPSVITRKTAVFVADYISTFTLNTIDVFVMYLIWMQDLFFSVAVGGNKLDILNSFL